MTVLDWREKQKIGGPDRDCGRLVKGRLVLRDPSQVTGITLHQTACRFGKRSSQDTRYERALGVHAHATVFDDGVGVVAYPLRAYVYHGNGANATRIGLECEGLFPGNTYSPDGPLCTDALIAGVQEMLEWLVRKAREEGMPITDIDAHRQWSDTRRGDPGREIWTRTVVEYAIPKLGLRCNQAFADAKKGGKPIPKSWDPDGIGEY